MTTRKVSPGVWAAVRWAVTAVVFVAIVVVLMMWLSGSFRDKVSASATAPNTGRLVGDAPLVAVRRLTVPAVETAVGTIRAVHEVSLASKLLARVLEVNVVAGQNVSAGEVLVRLDDADLKSRLQQAAAAVDLARATRDQAQIEFERIKRLLETDSAPQIEFDRATTALKSAEAELVRSEQVRNEAQTILDYATIAAPISGIIVDKKVEVGDTVSPGQVLLTLYDASRMQLVAAVRESLAHRLTVGNDIDVRVDALGKTCTGRISEIVPQAEAASRSFLVKVTGPCPPGIYSGMFGRLLIPLDEREIVVIPQSAIRRVGQLHVVDVACQDVLQRRIVQLGATIGADVEVLAGLQDGELVAVPAAQTPAAGG